jgi:hypothetical protein
MAQQRRYDDPTLAMEGFGIDFGEGNPTSASPPQMPAQAPQGSFDLEGIRKRLGFGQVDLTDPQGWLSQNQDVAFGTKLVGDKLYGPSGNFLADIIGDSKTGGTKSQFLDGIDSNTGQKRAPKPVKMKAPAPVQMPAYDPQPIPQAAPLPQQAVDTSTTTATSQKGPSMDDIGNQLKLLFPNGAYNQQLVTNRVSSASDALNRNRKSRLATNQALLAERGLIGDGPEAGAQRRMEEDLYDTFSGTVRDIHGDESARADDRMMMALQTAAGLSSEQAKLVIDRYRAENDDKYNMGNLALGNKNSDQSYELGQGNLALGHKTADNSYNLGLGNLALGNRTADNSYNLGLGNLGLGQDQLRLSAEQGDMSSLIQLLELYLNGASSTTDGAR